MSEKEKSLSITKTYNLAKPAEVVEMAKTLKSYVMSQNLYVEIKGKNYAMVEGWMFAGFLAGLDVMVEEPKNLSSDKEVKWSCTAKIYSGDKIVGVGYALCSDKEPMKKGFDEYAILSMSQTRSIGKAFRNKIGWVMKLANMESTPAEEMKEDSKKRDGAETLPEISEADMIDINKEVNALTHATNKKELNLVLKDIKIREQSGDYNTAQKQYFSVLIKKVVANLNKKS